MAAPNEIKVFFNDSMKRDRYQPPLAIALLYGASEGIRDSDIGINLVEDGGRIYMGSTNPVAREDDGLSWFGTGIRIRNMANGRIVG